MTTPRVRFPYLLSLETGLIRRASASVGAPFVICEKRGTDTRTYTNPEEQERFPSCYHHSQQPIGISLLVRPGVTAQFPPRKSSGPLIQKRQVGSGTHVGSGTERSIRETNCN